MAARCIGRGHAPDPLAQHRSPLHFDGRGRLAHLLRCARWTPCWRAPRANRWRRGDEVRLATSEFRIRQAVRCRVPEPRDPDRETDMKKTDSQPGRSASQLIDARIKELGDWRGEMLGRLRGLIKQADPEVIEEWKWRGVPVWSHDGLICTGETYKSVVKMTFAKGAALKDPARLFNSSLQGNTRRAIDFHEGEKIN